MNIFAEISEKPVAELSPETRLEEDLELKSLNKFALLAMLEGVLGSAPDLDTGNSMNTIQEFIDFYK